MKKLYLSGVEDRCGNVGDLHGWLTATVGIMMLLNCSILVASFNFTPIWLFLVFHLVPISMIVFWLFTTDDKYYNEYEEKKKEQMRN